MATEARPRGGPQTDGRTGCPYENDGSSTQRPLDLYQHRVLHEDGQRLITTWFQRAWERRSDGEATFESFIFAWISVNAWAACVTGEDQDHKYMRMLKGDPMLRQMYQDELSRSDAFRHEAEEFVELLPIFKAQRLRRSGLRPPEDAARQDVVRHYLEAGVTDYEPECAGWHRAQGQRVPNDWPHVISAIYRVRCNLFHGEKSAHSEMDRRIVRAAFMTLTGFFRCSRIL